MLLLTVCLWVGLLRGCGGLVLGARGLDVGLGLGAVEVVNVTEPPPPEGEDSDNNLSDIENSDDRNETLQQQCAAKQTSACVKLTLLRKLGRLTPQPSLELWPGLTVRGDMTSLQHLPSEVTAAELDDALLRCLASLSVTVRVVDSTMAQRIREIGMTLMKDPEDASTGRKRHGGSMLMAGLMSGGSMMALGMSAVAMMAGKALMTAMMSLMLSAMAAMKGGGGGGGGKSSYEVIHAGHDFNHRSIDVPPSDPDRPYPFITRRVYIPLHR